MDRPGQVRPDGIFATWAWDGTILRVENDRYGFYPLYYFSASDEICISPSIRTLVHRGAPTALDEAGLAVFLRAGFFLGEDTPFQAIRALPPNTVFSWENGRLLVTGTWPVVAPKTLSRSAATDEYIALFRASIKRRLPRDGHFIMPLSGGRDSRHILLELLDQGQRPASCVTVRHFAPRSDDDARLAGEVCTALRLPHLVLDQPRSRLRAEMRKNELTSFCSEEHAQMVVLADYLRGKTSTVYDGIAGDVLTTSHYTTTKTLPLYRAGRFTDLGLIYCAHEHILTRLLTPDFLARVPLELALERLAMEFPRHQDAANPISSFRLANRMRRQIAPAPHGIYREIAHVYCPYLDQDLYDLLASIPGEMLLDHRFHEDTVRRAYPAVSDIPFEGGHHPERRDPARTRRLAAELGIWLVRHGRSRLVRMPSLFARCAASLADADHSRLWRYSTLGIYLLQLELLAAGSSAALGQPAEA
jgi:hypothetical protein